MKDFSIVKNTYNKEDALEIISDLFRSKIKSLSSKSFSNQERFGDDKGCDKRIEELREELKNFRSAISELDNNMEVEVEANININIKVK